MDRLNRRKFLRAASGLFIPALMLRSKADTILSGPVMRTISSAVTIPTPTCYWKLDEVSGTRADSVGGQTLGDNGSVGSTTGVISNAASFNPTLSQWLSVASSATTQTGNIDFTIAAWVKLANTSTNRAVVSKYLITGNAREYEIQYTQSVNRFRFIVSPDGSSTGLGIATADNFGGPSTGVWYLVIAWHDSVNDQVGIQVMNSGDANTTAYSSGVAVKAASFGIGAQSNASTFMSGDIDEVYFCKNTVLSLDQRTALWNGGSGRTYPF